MSKLIFNVIDWNDYDIEIDDDEDEMEDFPYDSFYTMEAYGRTEDDKSVYLRIHNFTPYFFVEVSKKWGDYQLKRFVNYLQGRNYKYKDSIVEYQLKKKYKLYGFTAGKEFKFVMLVFNSMKAMRSYQYLLKWKHRIPGVTNAPKEYKLYESNIPPLLRFMHIKNINSSGWISVKKKKYKKLPSREYNTDIAIETSWSNIKSVESDAIAPLRILSFDIECTSGDGSFPQPSRDCDKIIQIGSTFSRNGEENCYYKHIVTLGSCDDIDDVDVESYDNEKDVLLSWQRIIEEKDPDIITGYNISIF